ncbi:viroplasmin family protein [Pseudomonas umsongensis]|uniref:ribonuclease H1 domain-containing protein n=1 Tax=Pseudomonas umsongensis TaxID=198618 RepID=UPI00200B8199|nr:ribonuclease H family protein [Pseudomonas umsongensis]MCK8658929.1 ribonuclease H family protein [Pseudomonas umsongensis]
MAKKFYVVWIGHQPGIFTDWATCERQTKGFKGAKFKSFPTREEAEQAFRGSPSAVPSKPAAAKSNAKSPMPINSASSPIKAASVDSVADVEIFSDGACRGNPGQAGSGLAVYRKGTLNELWYGLYASHGTNNTAELLGLHHALLTAKDELLKGSTVVIRSDSQYAIKSITEWAPAWERAKWMNGSTPRKNAELIKPMYELYQELKGQLTIHHVRGHHGIQGNELADRMAALAIDSEELELRRYTDPLDIDEILAFTPG